MNVDINIIPTVGDSFPDLSLPKLDGEELSFSELRGRKVLLFMWGSW